MAYGKRMTLAALVCALFLTLGLAPALAAGEVADLVLFGGKVLTVDRDFRITEAVAVKGDRILAVGSTAEVLNLAGSATKRIDLKGRMVLPGLTDTHTHLESSAETEYNGEVFIPLSVKALLDYVAEKVKTAKPGEWIYFRNTYPTRLEEYRFPNLAELDAVAPDNPVFVDGAYAGMANSAAMRVAGITKDTPQPATGEFVKDAKTGEPTGVFLRCQAMVTKYRPPVSGLTAEQRVAATKQLIANYNQVGFTGMIEGGSNAASIEVYNTLYQRGELNARVSLTLRPDVTQPFEKVAADLNKLKAMVKTPAEWAKVDWFKTTVDGGILTGTALMREPYGLTGPRHKEVFGHTDPNFRGVQTYDVDTYTRAAQMAYDLGLQMTAHCIGDGALDVLFEAYRRVDAKNSIKDRRWSAIHCDFTDYAMMQFMAEKGIICLGQVDWFYKDGDVLSQILTPRAIKSFYPYKTMEDLGVVAAGGSDHMVKWDSLLSVNPFNPWLGLYAMVTRQTERGGVLNPEERLSRESALRQYTINAAYATFAEKLKGSLEAGKLADLIVIDRDFLTCPAEQIKEMKVLLTMVDGRIVYQAE